MSTSVLKSKIKTVADKVDKNNKNIKDLMRDVERQKTLMKKIANKGKRPPKSMMEPKKGK